MSPEEQAVAARRGAALFRLETRGVLRVAGRDRVRWLDGMTTGDVSRMSAGAGCHALVLTARGRIVADTRILARDDVFWLDLERSGIPRLRAHLEKFIIADDVTLEDVPVARLSIEGPETPRILQRALGRALALPPEAWAEVELGGAAGVAAAYGVSGEPACQLFAPPDAERGWVEALSAAAEAEGAPLAIGSAAALEILRIEGGTPRTGAELDESVLPAEARLERALALDKGCYTGQEVVERLRTQGRVSHLLVGLRAEGAPPVVGADVFEGDRRVGEVTSACRSATAGAIGLAFVRRSASEPGTGLRAGEARVTACELPFVSPAASPA